MDRRGLIKLGAAAVAALAATTVNAKSTADKEVQVNRRHTVRVGDITGLRAVFFEDPDGHGWLEVQTRRGDCQTEMICKTDPACPIDPKALARQLQKLTGLPLQRQPAHWVP